MTEFGQTAKEKWKLMRIFQFNSTILQILGLIRRDKLLVIFQSDSLEKKEAEQGGVNDQSSNLRQGKTMWKTQWE